MYLSSLQLEFLCNDHVTLSDIFLAMTQSNAALKTKKKTKKTAHVKCCQYEKLTERLTSSSGLYFL